MTQYDGKRSEKSKIELFSVSFSTKGKIDDAPPKVKHFLNFVDGLPVKDDFVDEIKDLISELKETEKEKVNYNIALFTVSQKTKVFHEIK